MNFLAHIFLSGDDEEVMIGNFIADAVKGKDYLGYSDGIIKGVRLHRRIDAFTDSHVVVGESKRRLRPKYRKYAGVIVDMYYDHFLSKYWENYSEVSLSQFVGNAYEVFQSRIDCLPSRIQLMLPHMIEFDWLTNYAHLEGITGALGGLSRRARYDSGMEYAVSDLKQDYCKYKCEFELFFPELMNFSFQQQKELDQT